MGIGLAVIFAGYTLSYFGYCSLRGEGVGLLDLLVPGRDVKIPVSDGTGGSNGSSSSKAPTGLKSPAHTGAGVINTGSGIGAGTNGGLGGKPVTVPGGNPFPGPT